MITQGIENAVEVILEDTLDAGVYAAEAKRDVVAAKKRDVLSLIRAEAINLADKIIGKDIILHGSLDELDPADKAVFDFQVAQRVILADYQSNKKEGGTPTGPEMLIDSELAPNEA